MATVGGTITRAHERAPSIALPGILLGIGLGGFLDGILLHQVLQWHHMLSSSGADNIGIPPYPIDTVPGLEMNTLWDGLFHVFTWLAVLIGLAILYSRVVDARGEVWSSRVLWGWILFGWGLFNVVEGIVDHHLLGIHHVRDMPVHVPLYDWLFLGLGGVALIVLGWLMSRGGGRPARAATR